MYPLPMLLFSKFFLKPSNSLALLLLCILLWKRKFPFKIINRTRINCKCSLILSTLKVFPFKLLHFVIFSKPKKFALYFCPLFFVQSIGLMWFVWPSGVSVALLCCLEQNQESQWYLNWHAVALCNNHDPLAGRERRIVMRMIWGFLSQNVCHDLRLMHASMSNHFPLLVHRNRRLGKM